MELLPTTPGSIVTFDLPPDSDGTVHRAVAALIPGHIDENGTAHDMVWASAELTAPDDAACVFAPEVILASNPELLVQTERAAGPVEEVREPGTVIRVFRAFGVETFTFAPSFFYGGQMQELFWTNAYGGYLPGYADVDVRVLYVPQRRA